MELNTTSTSTKEFTQTNFPNDEAPIPFIQKSKFFLSTSGFILATILFLLNIFLVFMVVSSFVDSIFHFCTYRNPGMGTISGKCSSIFGWYGLVVEFLSVLVLFSTFFGLFIPLLIYIYIYIALLNNLFSIKDFRNEKEIKTVKVLTLSTKLFPFILLVSLYFIFSNAQKIIDNQNIKIQIRS